MPTRPLRLNPLFERVLGSEHAFLRSNPDRVFALTPDTIALLDALAQARPLTELLPDPTPEQLAVVDQLVALGLVLEPEQGPAPYAWEPPLQPAFRARRWPGRVGASERPVVIVGACFDATTSSVYPRGASRGPSVLRAAAWDYPLTPEYGLPDVDRAEPFLRGAELLDAGDLVVEPGCSFAEFGEALQARLTHLSARASCLLLGGDHGVSLPAIAAAAAHHEQLGVLHFDAHADLGVEERPTRVTHANVMRHVVALPQVVSLVQVGLRGIQALPRSRAGYATFSVGAARREPEAIVAAMRTDIPWYISVDIDVLDPAVAPATGAPEPDGFMLAELRGLLRRCSAEVRVVGADLVEVQQLPGDRLTGRAGALIMLELAELLRSRT